MPVFLRVLSALLAAALLALGVIVAAEVVFAALGQPAWVLPYQSLSSTLRDSTWTSGIARLIGGVLSAVGLLLFLLSLRRGRPADLPLTSTSDNLDATVHRRGLQSYLRAAVDGVDGVRRAKVRVGRRKVKVTASSALRDPGAMPQEVEQRVRASLDELALRRSLAVKVTTKRRS